jgi:crossover junction endodeoxyribonuclease RuvC
VYVECGVLRAPTRERVPARLLALAHDLGEVIDELRPDVVALERAFHGKNAHSALVLGQARGAIMLVVGQHGLPVVEYAPAAVKRAVIGHGRATKQTVQDRMRLLFRLRRAPDSDAADALAIAACHGLCAGGRGLGAGGRGRVGMAAQGR